jgi:hypothetical protein
MCDLRIGKKIISFVMQTAGADMSYSKSLSYFQWYFISDALIYGWENAEVRKPARSCELKGYA